jgi:hypothetical protein
VLISKQRRGAVVRWTAGGAIAAALLAAGVVLYAVVDFDRADHSSPLPTARTDQDEPAAEPTGPPSVPEAQPADPTVVRFAFEVSPDHARIYVDGRPLPVGAREVTLPADGQSHKIDVNAKGYVPQELDLSADRDQAVPVVLAEIERKGKVPGKKKAAAAAKGKKPRPGKKKKLKESPY